jgi:myo-inositol-1(or 4)-monophosphatase
MAGVLIAREAGALVLDLDGGQHTVQSASTIAVPPQLAAELLALLQPVTDDR